MNYRLLLLLSLLLFLASVSIKIWMVKAQRQRKQVGTPSCNVFVSNSASATKCARTKCLSPQGDSFENYERCTPDPYTQDKQICEAVPTDCELTQSVSCSDGDRTISYNYYCPNSNLSTGNTLTIICPVTCTKCLVKPNLYNQCPRGYYNDNGCCIPREQIACTTPAINGSCPLGGPPDEFGMCCSSADCGEPVVYPCNAYLPANNCPYTFEQSPCPPSPVLIDVAGNGFDLTDAAEG
jgi:hypothetical protein